MGMMGVRAVFWREMVIFRRRLKRILAGYAISPLLFLIAFGWGMGRGVTVQGVDYLSFMIPGLMALASMSQSFAIATDINVARFYWMTFEEFQTAPISCLAITLGETLAGVCRGLLAASVIGAMALAAGAQISFTPWLLLAVFLNSFQFAAAAVMAAMLVRSHADQGSLTSFIIVPMSFLCGTFFPLDRLPDWAAWLVGLLPLTYASRSIRAAALGGDIPYWALSAMAIWGLALLTAAAAAVRKASI
jgi:ABC-type multidrug transport system permease subunit